MPASQNLSQTLAIGNDSGAYNIQMSTGTGIVASNGGASIYLDNSSVANTIFISTDGIGSESMISMDPTLLILSNQTGGISLLSTDTIQSSATNRIILDSSEISMESDAVSYVSSRWIYKTKELINISNRTGYSDL